MPNEVLGRQAQDASQVKEVLETTRMEGSGNPSSCRIWTRSLDKGG